MKFLIKQQFNQQQLFRNWDCVPCRNIQLKSWLNTILNWRLPYWRSFTVELRIEKKRSSGVNWSLQNWPNLRIMSGPGQRISIWLNFSSVLHHTITFTHANLSTLTVGECGGKWQRSMECALNLIRLKQWISTRKRCHKCKSRIMHSNLSKFYVSWTSTDPNWLGRLA